MSRLRKAAVAAAALAAAVLAPLPGHAAERGQRGGRPPRQRRHVRGWRSLRSGHRRPRPRPRRSSRPTTATSRSSCWRRPSTSMRAPAPTPRRSAACSEAGAGSWSSIPRTSGSPQTCLVRRRASTAPSWPPSTPPTARTPSPPACWQRPTSSGSEDHRAAPAEPTARADRLRTAPLATRAAASCRSC